MDLYEAIAAGDLATVTTMLAEDPTMGASRHPSGPTPVLYALYQRQPAVARALATLVGQLSLAEAAAPGLPLPTDSERVVVALRNR